jgi:hypothetical protein
VRVDVIVISWQIIGDPSEKDRSCDARAMAYWINKRSTLRAWNVPLGII